MSFVLPLAALVLTAAAASPAGAAGDPARLAAAARVLEREAYAATPEPLIEARAEIERLLQAEPRSARLHYWLAVADWRLVPRLMDRPKQARRYLEDGLLHARRAIELDPRHAEAMAVESSLLGLSTRLDPGTVMSVGPRIEAGMQRARTLAPDNPRVALLDAMGTLHKPEFVGGGAAPALAKLTRAQELFAADTVDRASPSWGRAEAWIWAGRAAAQLGDTTAARAHYRRALEIQPGNGWVQRVLLPQLDGAAGAADGAAVPPAGRR